MGGFPLFALQKPGDPPFFFGARDGFGIPILDFGQLQIGPVATINYPRYVWQYQQLNGLGEVPWALQLRGYAQWWATPWLRLRGEVRQGIGGETGVTGNLYVDAVVPLGQWRLSAVTDGAIGRRGVSVFQHHAGAVGKLWDLGSRAATGLQRDWRVLFVWRRRADRIFL